jgi:hypothetical protein
LAIPIVILGVGFWVGGLSGCMSAYRESVGGDPDQVYIRTYLTDINTAWESVLQALRASPIDITNREAGFIQTRWIDNTEQRNFTDSFGAGADYVLKAQYRFRVNVSKTFYKGEPCAKVTVQKDQLVQIDVLEGWQRRESDSIEENTLLYRIGRIIYMQLKIAKNEEMKMKQEMKDSGIDLNNPAPSAPPASGAPAGSGDLPPPN